MSEQVGAVKIKIEDTPECLTIKTHSIGGNGKRKGNVSALQAASEMKSRFFAKAPAIYHTQEAADGTIWVVFGEAATNAVNYGVGGKEVVAELRLEDHDAIHFQISNFSDGYCGEVPEHRIDPKHPGKWGRILTEGIFRDLENKGFTVHRDFSFSPVDENNNIGLTTMTLRITPP